MKRQRQALSLKTLTKSNVWDIQENDVFRLWAQAEHNADLKDNERHYLDILKSAFTIEEVKVNRPEFIRKYEARGCSVGDIRIDDGNTKKWAVKKKPIIRTTDLTWENIHHISARKLVEILDRNFGGGWESLPQSVQDIIQNGFDVSTTTLPTDRLKKPGGLYAKKVSDGFEVLEIPKGKWTEAIFVKAKPKTDHYPELDIEEEAPTEVLPVNNSESDNEEVMPEVGDKNSEEDDDTFDDDKLTEESYRTTFETDAEDLEMQAEDISDEEDF